MSKSNVFEETVKFNKKEFEEAIDKAFDKKKADIKLDGFRKGKVPKDVYFKKNGKESLYMDALNVLLPEAYDRALKDYKPIIDPKVDIKSIDEILYRVKSSLLEDGVTQDQFKELSVLEDDGETMPHEIHLD